MCWFFWCFQVFFLRVGGETCSLGCKGRCVDCLTEGGAAFSASGGEFLPQLPDFSQQDSLAVVQVGAASVQGD